MPVICSFLLLLYDLSCHLLFLCVLQSWSRQRTAVSLHLLSLSVFSFPHGSWCSFCTAEHGFHCSSLCPAPSLSTHSYLFTLISSPGTLICCVGCLVLIGFSILLLIFVLFVWFVDSWQWLFLVCMDQLHPYFSSKSTFIASLRHTKHFFLLAGLKLSIVHREYWREWGQASFLVPIYALCHFCISVTWRTGWATSEKLLSTHGVTSQDKIPRVTFSMLLQQSIFPGAASSIWIGI